MFVGGGVLVSFAVDELEAVVVCATTVTPELPAGGSVTLAVEVV